MKKQLLFLLLLTPATVFCQGLLNRIKQKVKSKTEQRIDQKIDKGIDKTLDKADSSAKKGTTAKENAEPAVSAATTASTGEPELKSYSRFDFIPGEEIVYTENFEQEAAGELPTGWNTSGSGEIVTLNNFSGKWLQIHQNTVYLTSNQKEFGENYTVEFDLILQLKSNGHFYPYFSFALFSSGAEPSTGNNFLREYKKNAALETIVYPAELNRSKISVNSYNSYKYYYRGDDKVYGDLQQYFGKPVHVAVQVQKERCRIWFNQDKLFDIPKGIPPGQIMNQLQFQVHIASYKENEYGMFIGNLKVAKGIPDTRHKLVEEGKFSTTGILFDVNAAVIRPESYGVVKEIAKVLQENAAIKVKIVGHTDSDGSDAANLGLSQKRAEAVVKLLAEEFGIDAGRMEAEGRGETQPVAENKTKEGKAANRRVEFIKL